MIDPAFYKQSTLPDLISGQETPALPQMIGPYKIESQLSQGGMSLLYLGIHPTTQKPIAVKVLSPAYVNHVEAKERFLKEAEIIATACHPNIVKLYGHGEWEKGLYIGMEFIQGISMRLFILKQSLSMRRCLEIILQVAYALLHLHSHGVIHRDLKPENILITEDGEIKVIDFGIAQLHTDKETVDQTFVGTPNYMSPEQKDNPSAASFASDIYALGVILYELLTGKLSYGVVNLTLLPKHLRQIVSKALAVSVQERYAEMSSFIHDLSEYLNSKEIDKEKPGGDEIKEMYEILGTSIQKLSPLTFPLFPSIEIGIAKTRNIQHLGLCYDCLKLPNNSYLVFLSSASETQISGCTYTGSLRGMIKALMLPYLKLGAPPFQLAPWLNSLNELLASDPSSETFAFCALFLDPVQETLTHFSAGMPGLIHVPQESGTPHYLLSQNPLLGALPAQEFSLTKDNWNVGDSLFLHSLMAVEDLYPHPFEQQLLDITAEHHLLAPSRAAENILKNISSSPHFQNLRHSKAIIAIDRIA